MAYYLTALVGWQPRSSMHSSRKADFYGMCAEVLSDLSASVAIAFMPLYKYEYIDYIHDLLLRSLPWQFITRYFRVYIYP